MFGNEAHGLPAEILDAADHRVRVPHAGRAESLNLAAAATVCLFEWVRRGRTSAETLEDLVAAAAHDIRSPLTAMKGFGYALGKRWGDMTPDQRDLMLDGILHDVDRMDTIVRQLVDAARVMSGRFQAYVELTDVSTSFGRSPSSRSRDPEHPPIEWAGDGEKVLIDAGRLRTTLLGFAEALVWWGSEGPIRVESQVRDDRLVVSASRETATPVDADTLFEARRPGTGGGSKIGLYVARRVAEAQGGRAWAELTDGTPHAPRRAADRRSRLRHPVDSATSMDAQQMLRSLDDERERGLRAFSEAATIDELEAARCRSSGGRPRSRGRATRGRDAGTRGAQTPRQVVNETRAALQLKRPTRGAPSWRPRPKERSSSPIGSTCRFPGRAPGEGPFTPSRSPSTRSSTSSCGWDIAWWKVPRSRTSGTTSTRSTSRRITPLGR